MNFPNHSINDLEWFALQCDTDKQGRQNGYLSLYLEYFERQDLKRNSPLKILEIGTNKGSSLRMWAEYFPNAHVYGLDITRQYEIKDMLDHKRIHTALGNQGDRDALFQAMCEWGIFRGDFNIIIDDGSHDQKDQQISLACLFPMLSPGGLYVLEDIITGEPWMNGDLYNISHISQTRHMIMILEATGKVVSEVMKPDEIQFLEQSIEHCKYKESRGVVFVKHLPQLAFLTAKK